MLRTNAVATYGIRAALQGWLIPPPLIGSARPDIARDLLSAGHEVELHAWDHRSWQDTLARRGESWVREWFGKAIEAHVAACGAPPACFGAPAWLLSPIAVKVIGGLGIKYLSCTRAQQPFMLKGCGLVEIPGNIPCLEETGSYASIHSAARQAGGGVITLHAEVEGGPAADRFLPELVEPLLTDGARLVPLGELRGMLNADELPEREFELKLLPGRADECAV
jgi:peptidoglycan/xylan/chitin deacetylase (PgdA/CDA1 family)